MLTQSCIEFMRLIINAAQKYVQHNTTANTLRITDFMYQRAVKALDIMKDACEKEDLDAFNMGIMKLYSAIPRLVKDREFLLSDKNDIKERYIWEEEVINKINDIRIAMLNKIQTCTKEQSILDKSGLSITEADENDIKTVKGLMGSDSDKLQKVFKVTNRKREEAFQNYLAKAQNKETALLWHGSGIENFLSIFQNGLKIDRASFGMFGKGLYAAPKFQKARGYTSVSGAYWNSGNDNFALLGIFEGAIGNRLDLRDYNSLNCGSLYPGDPQLRGRNVVWCHRGTAMNLYNDEIVFYNEDCLSIRYLCLTA